MDAKGLADTGPESICLNEKRDQISHFFEVRAVGQISQRFLSSDTGP
jgi:hypothetical protein